MANDGEVVSDEQMVRDFKAALHANLKAGKLGATALVTGLKAIQSMIPPPPPVKADEGEPFSLLDQLPSLPVAAGKKLLVAEIARLRSELDAHETWLEYIGEPNGQNGHMGSH